jgi:hypothetical protein
MKCLCRNGKVCHESFDEAATARDAHSKRIGLPLAVYFCKFCRSWHLTKIVFNKPDRWRTEET